MADHMSAMPTQKGLMEQMQMMRNDQQMMEERAMRRGMDDMHEHMAATSKDLDKTLQTMEQMQKRRGATPPAPKKP